MPILATAHPYHAGDGPVGVLFCHGFTAGPTSVREWAEVTAAAGHRVSLPRLPGHGTIWQELAVTHWRDWYDAADAAYRDLSDQCDHVFVAGLSMGGALALRLAEHHTDVAGLVLVNPALGAVDRLNVLAPVLRHVVPTRPAIGSDIAQPGQVEPAYDLTPVAAVATLRRLWADVRSCLDLVTCPIVVFRSRADHIVPASSTETILRQVSSLDVTERVLEDSYHVATMDHDRATIFNETLAFIDRVVADAQPTSAPSASA